ncbi:hypothetical protein HK096_010924, partial [Nowakowskiella sp. JEL0078]
MNGVEEDKRSETDQPSTKERRKIPEVSFKPRSLDPPDSLFTSFRQNPSINLLKDRALALAPVLALVH